MEKKKRKRMLITLNILKIYLSIQSLNISQSTYMKGATLSVLTHGVYCFPSKQSHQHLFLKMQVASCVTTIQFIPHCVQGILNKNMIIAPMLKKKKLFRALVCFTPPLPPAPPPRKVDILDLVSVSLHQPLIGLIGLYVSLYQSLLGLYGSRDQPLIGLYGSHDQTLIGLYGSCDQPLSLSTLWVLTSWLPGSSEPSLHVIFPYLPSPWPMQIFLAFINFIVAKASCLHTRKDPAIIWAL